MIIRIVVGLALSTALSCVVFVSSAAADWIHAPSTYSHDPNTGDRTNQFAQIGPFFVYGTESNRQSGYHHYRSSIQANGSADNLHIVERWGDEVRPYGEWRFPYRPYSAPYSQWGQPYGGLNITPFGPGYGQPFPAHGGRGPGNRPGMGPGPAGAFDPSYGTGYGRDYEHSPYDSPRRDRGRRRIAPQPWHDGHHPQYNQQQSGADFFYGNPR